MTTPFHHLPLPRLWAIAAGLMIAGCASTPPIKASAATAVTRSAHTTQVGDGEAALRASFERWIAEFGTSARAAGIDEATLQTAFSNVHFLPRAIALDRAQPEFTRPVWDYLDQALSAERISRGQAKLRQLQADVGPISVRYGVPIEVLFAFWGVESDFGSNLGEFSAIDALATLAFEGRRTQWAQTELIAALQILQNHDIERSRMLGSWAGAMGQTQFMPTIFLRYAVDADGDGRRDLWNSIPDVMASTANFVAQSGWKVDEPWGHEVRLPPGFDFARADMDVRLPSSAWAHEGLLCMDGSPLPALADSSIILPAGARGPAFLVGTNFRTILRYNNATSYALAVALLAQQLAGGPGVLAPWPRDEITLSMRQVQALQEALAAQGIDSGPSDGLLGPATQRGIRHYQQRHRLPADGYPSSRLLQRLLDEGSARP